MGQEKNDLPLDVTNRAHKLILKSVFCQPQSYSLLYMWKKSHIVNHKFSCLLHKDNNVKVFL